MMKMPFKIRKSISLLRFLNREQNVMVSYFFSILIGIATFALTFERKLSFAAARTMFANRNLKESVRWIYWLAGKRLPRFVGQGDIFFNFCNAFSTNELTYLLRFVQRQQSKRNDLRGKLDELKIYANQLMAYDKLVDEIQSARFAQLSSEIQKIITTRDAIENQIQVTSNQSSGLGLSAGLGEEILQDFSRLFPVEDKTWFVISGTFLGAVRENNFLKHDLDIDLGIISEKINLADFMKKMEASSDFKVTKVEYQKRLLIDSQTFEPPLIAFVTLVHSSNVNVDLFWNYNEADIMWHGTSELLWENTTFTLGAYLLGRMKVYGPSPAATYLKETYGNWKTEAQGYNFHRDMPSLKGAQNFLGWEYELRKCAMLGTAIQ